MEPDGSPVENEHDLDDMSNVSITATTPSSLGDVVASHDDLPNSDHDIAGAGQNMTNTGSTLYNPPLDKQPFQRHDLIKALWVHYTSHFIWTGFTASRLLTAGTV